MSLLRHVHYTLIATSIIPNSNKSFWTLRQRNTWLGIDINITNNIMKIKSERISSIFYTIQCLIDKVFISARELPKTKIRIIEFKVFPNSLLFFKRLSLCKLQFRISCLKMKSRIYCFDCQSNIFWLLLI